MRPFQKPLVPFGIFSSNGRLIYKGDSDHGNSDRKQNYKTGDVYRHIFGLSFVQTFSCSLYLSQTFYTC